MNHKLIGQWGESCAAEYLEKQGYTILARNYSTRFGELDLVAKKQSILAFVEVKLRKNSYFGAACEFVTATKQKKLRLTAEFFLQEHEELLSLQPRFDVVEIYTLHGVEKEYQLNYIENAF